MNLRSQLFRPETRNPKIPISLEEELNVFDFYFVVTVWWSIVYAMLGEKARTIDNIFHKLVGYLQEAIFNFLWNNAIFTLDI